MLSFVELQCVRVHVNARAHERSKTSFRVFLFLHPKHWDFRSAPLHPTLDMAAENLISSPYTCASSTVETKLFPSPHNPIFKDSTCI